MRPIQESLSNVRPITDYIASKNQVDEGLLDGLKKAKEKLKQITNKVSSWAKGIVAKLQTWWMAVDGEGNILPCSTPLTAGQAYKDGLINKKSTFVALGSQSGRVVGLNQSFDDAKKLYPTTLEWWKELSKKAVNESDEEEFKKQFTQIDEVQMQNTDPQAKYNVITTPEKLRAQVKMHVVNPAFARLMIWGAPGIGKTAILNEVVAEISREQKQDYALITKTLSNETPENFMLPKYTESGDRAEDVPKTDRKSVV